MVFLGFERILYGMKKNEFLFKKMQPLEMKGRIYKGV